MIALLVPLGVWLGHALAYAIGWRQASGGGRSNTRPGPRAMVS